MLANRSGIGSQVGCLTQTTADREKTAVHRAAKCRFQLGFQGHKPPLFHHGLSESQQSYSSPAKMSGVVSSEIWRSKPPVVGEYNSNKPKHTKTMENLIKEALNQLHFSRTPTSSISSDGFLPTCSSDGIWKQWEAKGQTSMEFRFGIGDNSIQFIRTAKWLEHEALPANIWLHHRGAVAQCNTTLCSRTSCATMNQDSKTGAKKNVTNGPIDGQMSLQKAG